MVSESRMGTVFVFGGFFYALDFDLADWKQSGCVCVLRLFSALDFDHRIWQIGYSLGTFTLCCVYH